LLHIFVIYPIPYHTPYTPLSVAVSSVCSRSVGRTTVNLAPENLVGQHFRRRAQVVCSLGIQFSFRRPLPSPPRELEVCWFLPTAACGHEDVGTRPGVQLCVRDRALRAPRIFFKLFKGQSHEIDWALIDME